MYKYLKSGQVVPGKGTAWMLYEIEGEDTIVRMLTHIPENNEIKLYPNPKMKKLFQPERLEESNKDEFEYIWGSGESGSK
ncbi:MAG: hypothetical protein KDK41_09110 [Leptospiraceae bacterium]|nr:hypothetical protein [Leptospiraceae bacterium]MCB1200791.1 hypothetical protein [Leptospiraceae bacterium]